MASIGVDGRAAAAARAAATAAALDPGSKDGLSPGALDPAVLLMAREEMNAVLLPLLRPGRPGSSALKVMRGRLRPAPTPPTLPAASLPRAGPAGATSAPDAAVATAG